MKLTATEFRKNLFTILERVVRGETVDVVYKGSMVRVAPIGASSKLSRAMRQATLLCDPAAIVRSDRRLLARMESGWRKDWSRT